MKALMIFILSLFVFFSPLFAGERFSIQLPEEWKIMEQKITEDGKVFEIWENVDERIVIVASPFGTNEKHSFQETMSCFIAMMNMGDASCKVIERLENEALIADENTIYKMCSTQNAFHGIFYTYVNTEYQEALSLIKNALITTL